MLVMSDEQILGNFKEVFPPKIEAQLLEIEVIGVARGETRVLILLLKLELLHGSMLVHMIQRIYSTICTNETNRREPKTFCITGKHLAWLPRMTHKMAKHHISESRP